MNYQEMAGGKHLNWSGVFQDSRLLPDSNYPNGCPHRKYQLARGTEDQVAERLFRSRYPEFFPEDGCEEVQRNKCAKLESIAPVPGIDRAILE